MKLSAVIFDLDDTLLLDEEVTRAAFADAGRVAAERTGVDGARFAAQAAEIAERLWREGPWHGHCAGLGIAASECLWGTFSGNKELDEWAREFRVETFRRALAESGAQGNGSEESEAFAALRRSGQHLLPGAEEVLAALRGRFRLGLLTNGDAHLQRFKLAACGLGRFFDEVLVSGEAGVGKPDPSVFALLLGRLGVAAAGAAMVGNSLARDIVGAKAAGFALTILLEVPGAAEHANTSPDRVIRSLRELPGILNTDAG